jgi:hypothetical protein
MTGDDVITHELQDIVTQPWILGDDLTMED